MSTHHTKETYYAFVLREVERIVSWQDRESFSPTYGCFDRTYWGWKFTDFSGARFQEGVYSLAHLFHHEFPGNSLAGSARIFDWMLAGMGYWRRLQHSDGSFDEAYPHEHSLAATAFTLFYVGEAFLLVKDAIPVEQKQLLRHTMAKAGDWLCKNDETHGILSNHLAAAAAALDVAFRICGEGRFQQRSQYFLNRIYDHQSVEGWYEEYSGADPGYQTHATFYLARLWQASKDGALLESLKNSLRFLKHFIHPNGTLGGEYGSRNTEFYFPAGLEIMAPTIADAQLIANFMRDSVANTHAAGLPAMDSYNFLPMLNNYLYAAEAFRELDVGDTTLPWSHQIRAHYPEAGVFVKSTPWYFAVLGLSKGGVLKVYDKRTKRLHVSDCGYWARLSNGQLASNQNLTCNGEVSVSDDVFTVVQDFSFINQRTLTPVALVVFRLFSTTFGRFRWIASWLKNSLVHVLVKRKRPAALQLQRRVHFAEDSILVTDTIKRVGSIHVDRLQSDKKFATIHMGSSRYFQRQELESQYPKPEDYAEKLNANQICHIEQTYIFRT